MILKTIKVKFSYIDKIILNNLNFSLKQGEIAAILGESGAGKSTFLKILNGLIPISSGKILFKNKDIYLYNPSSLRKKFCYIPQVPVAISNNVFNEFKTVNSLIKKEKILNLLYEFKLDDSILDKSMNNLSIGQQQRIAILRGMVNNPEIILLDEPTSALDEENIDLLRDIIKNLNKKLKISFVVVTHNLLFAKNIADKIYLLKNSRLEDY